MHVDGPLGKHGQITMHCLNDLISRSDESRPLTHELQNAELRHRQFDDGTINCDDMPIQIDVNRTVRQ